MAFHIQVVIPDLKDAKLDVSVHPFGNSVALIRWITEKYLEDRYEEYIETQVCFHCY